jgi:tetratricopeptide (TPR) repeat protein
LVVAVRIEDAASGQLIAETSRTAPDEEAVVATVHAVAMELRRSLGDTRAALASTEPLPLVLTASLEALRRYRDAEGLSQAVRFPEAAQAYREALTIDPAFAEARVSLAQSYNNMGFEDSATVEQQRALTTPERLRDVRRRDVEASLRFYSDYASWDESMFRSGQRTNDALRLSYFNHFDSAVTLVELEIRDEVRRVRRFDPDRQLRTEGLSWINSIGWAIASGRFEELAALRDSLAVAPTPYWLLRSSIVSGDWRRADSLRIAFPGAWFSFVFRSLDAARGRIRESHDGWSEIPALILEVVYGVPAVDAGAQLIDRRLMTVGEYVQHGVQAAFLGDTAEAKRVSTRLREARASATSALFEQSFGPLFALIDAGISMRRGDWDAAVETLAPRAKRANEPGHVFGSGTPYLVRWVLADAYTHLGEPEAAIQELDAVLQVCDDMAWHLLAYPAAHFRLGRLHAQLDNAGQAREHFVTFLDTFTDPDPDYEWMVEEARAEVERLGRGD